MVYPIRRGKDGIPANLKDNLMDRFLTGNALLGTLEKNSLIVGQ